MKMRIVACAIALGVPAAVQAQAADTAAIAAQQAAMAKLAQMRGIWRGPAVARTPQGEVRMTHTERAGTFLDGTLTLVEGKAYVAEDKIGFHAFAAISYDAATKSYWMSSHAQGRSGRFQLSLTDNGWRWEIPAGPAKIQYVASFAGGKWSETGDYVAPGQPPRRVFEMTLSRVGDTDWPEAAASRNSDLTDRELSHVRASRTRRRPAD